jgi:AhpD family alkylhydroperoxidase
MGLGQAYAGSSLDGVEQQVVLIAASALNGCT